MKSASQPAHPEGTEDQRTVVGRAVPHESAVGHVTGAALYTDDLFGRDANTLHAWPVTAPHAHARVLEIDPSRAIASPGVVRVLSAQDVPGENNVGALRRDEPLFPSEISHHGQAVVWVLGETEAAARRGAAEVEITYDSLPAIRSIQEAITQESYLTAEQVIESGEPERELAHAPHSLSGELLIGGQEHLYLEPNAALAYLDESGQMLVHSSTQHPSETQTIVARVLGVPKNQVVCQSLRMGGAFGGKEVQANPWAAVAAVGAQKTGRPVRLRLSRYHDMTMTGKRHPFLAKYQLGFTEQGVIRALKLELFSDGGFSLDLSGPIVSRAMFHCDNVYRIPSLRVTGRACRTHKPSNTAFRGFGGPQGMLVIEECLDRVARTLRLLPHEVRKRNFYRPGDKTHYGQEVKDAERIGQAWALAQSDSQMQQRWLDVERFNQAHPHTKRGLAITAVKFGISFTKTAYNQAGALVLIYTDGSVQVNHGGTEMGQGLHTKVSQIAAEALGVSLDAVRVMPTRTDKIPNTSPTAASSGADLNGAAVRDACDQLKARLLPVASALLGCPEADVTFTAGVVSGANKQMEFSQVVSAAYSERLPLFAAGSYRTPGLHFDPDTGRGHPFHYFAYGAAVTEAEVDGFTGQTRLLRVDIVHDAGDSLSPALDRGQIEGGYVQGAGWLTQEELRWTDQGALATSGASTYKIPSVDDCPEDFRVRLLPRATEPGAIYGSKAVGEPPLMLALSAREAIRQAISAFEPGGAPDRVELDCPATPEAVYWAIQALRSPAHGSK